MRGFCGAAVLTAVTAVFLISVVALDSAATVTGPGALTVTPTQVTTGSSDNTLTFTYTAAPAGLSGGELKLTVPKGWTAPQKKAKTAPGFVSASPARLTVSKSILSLKRLTLCGGCSATITYTDATAPTTIGPSMFEAAAAGAGKRVKPLGADPEVTVVSASQPVALGNPGNSLGTGNLTLGSPPAGVSPAPTCGGVNCAHYWLGISGFCAAREDGDEFSSFYAGDRADGNTDCPDDTEVPSPNPSASTIFDNPDYRSTGYTYDVDVPGNGSTADPATPEDVTVEIYDPAYNPVRETGSVGSCTVTAPGSIPGDSATGWGTDGTCPGYNNSEVNTDWLLETPGSGSSGTGTVIDPFGASTSDPGVFLSGDTTCENNWCSLGTIPSGSAPGDYQLHLWTQADEPNSYGTNQFALRAVLGDGPGVGNACGANGSLSSCTGAVDTTTFTPCSTTAQYGEAADPLCPEVHGAEAMSIFVDSAGTATCDPGPRQEQPAPAAPVTTPEPCSTFYLAQAPPDDAGKKMDIILFDPGEGATAIRVLQPDATAGASTDGVAGVSPASFTYETCDDATAGCPGLPSDLDGPSPVPASDFYSSDGLDPPVATISCICDTGLTPGPLPGRASASQYNDRYLLIETTVPSAADLAANGGWYMVEYTFGGSSVTDRTTWSVSI
jgi:hypothetical protein